MKDVPDFASKEDPSQATFVDIEDLVPRPIRPDEVPELRAMWWRQAALGHRLPAELGVIVINGRSV